MLEALILLGIIIFFVALILFFTDNRTPSVIIMLIIGIFLIIAGIYCNLQSKEAPEVVSIIRGTRNLEVENLEYPPEEMC